MAALKENYECKKNLFPKISNPPPEVNSITKRLKGKSLKYKAKLSVSIEIENSGKCQKFRY